MGRCNLLLCRQWREEPWGYPQRPQAAILSLKFPTSVKNQPLLTRTYRFLFAIGWCFWVFYSALGNDPTKPNPEWCIYVTDWSAAVMGGYTVAALLNTLWPRIRWLDVAAWFLHSIAAPLAIMVTVLYWATSIGAENDIVSWHLHLANALLMLMDTALSRYPYSLKHFPAPLAFILSYLIFNGIWFATTGGVVYPSLDWGNNLPFALVMICATLFLLLPATHLLLWRLDLATFVLSVRWKRRRALQVVAEEVAGGGAPRDVPSKKGKAGPLDHESPLKDAVLARRWLAEEGEEDEQVQTPSTGGSAAASDAGDVEAAVSPAAPAGVVGA